MVALSASWSRRACSACDSVGLHHNMFRFASVTTARRVRKRRCGVGAWGSADGRDGEGQFGQSGERGTGGRGQRGERGGRNPQRPFGVDDAGQLQNPHLGPKRIQLVEPNAATWASNSSARAHSRPGLRGRRNRSAERRWLPQGRHTSRAHSTTGGRSCAPPTPAPRPRAEPPTHRGEERAERTRTRTRPPASPPSAPWRPRRRRSSDPTPPPATCSSAPAPRRTPGSHPAADARA
ncbi:MAG: hypothetical protein JWR32_4156 [Mycobacterium sp.]|nr:hypothetical protein [Mycobacterium sp.]